jgi:hypothetical protein
VEQIGYAGVVVPYRRRSAPMRTLSSPTAATAIPNRSPLAGVGLLKVARRVRLVENR